MAKWSDLIRRDQVLEIWWEGAEKRATHTEFIHEVERQIKTDTGQEVKVDHEELVKMCEQIRKGMLKQLDKVRENNPNPTDFERNMWTKAENRIPVLLPGAKKAARTNYGDLFKKMMQDIQHEG